MVIALKRDVLCLALRVASVLIPVQSVVLCSEGVPAFMPDSEADVMRHQRSKLEHELDNQIVRVYLLYAKYVGQFEDSAQPMC
jgi:hypothetical protein